MAQSEYDAELQRMIAEASKQDNRAALRAGGPSAAPAVAGAIGTAAGGTALAIPAAGAGLASTDFFAAPLAAAAPSTLGAIGATAAPIAGMLATTYYADKEAQRLGLTEGGDYGQGGYTTDAAGNPVPTQSTRRIMGNVAQSYEGKPAGAASTMAIAPEKGMLAPARPRFERPPALLPSHEPVVPGAPVAPAPAPAAAPAAPVSARSAFSQKDLPTYKDLLAEGLNLAGPTDSWATAVANSNFAKGYAGNQFRTLLENQKQRERDFSANAQADNLAATRAAAAAKADKADKPMTFSVKNVTDALGNAQPGLSQLTLGDYSSVALPTEQANQVNQQYQAILASATAHGINGQPVDFKTAHRYALERVAREYAAATGQALFDQGATSGQ